MGLWDCATGVDVDTKGSTVRARCNYGLYRVQASCLRPDGTGLQYTTYGKWYEPGSASIISAHADERQSQSIIFAVTVGALPRRCVIRTDPALKSTPARQRQPSDKRR